MSKKYEHVEVVAASIDDLPSGVVAGLTELYGGTAPGDFLRGSFGFTHYLWDKPQEPRPLPRKVALIAYGVGNNINLVTGLVAPLVARGYSVLRYDYVSHGWSLATKAWFKATPSVLLRQLEELLEHVLSPGEPIDLIFGFSMGAVLGTLAASSLSRNPTRQLAFLDGAFFASPPDLVAKLAFAYPSLMFTAVSSLGALGRKLVRDAELNQANRAFALADDGKTFRFPDALAQTRAGIMSKHRLHPQAANAFGSVGGYCLRPPVCKQARDALADVTNRDDSLVQRVLLMPCERSRVQPIKRAPEIVALAADKTTLVRISDRGHEAIQEGIEPVISALTKWLDETGAIEA